MKIVHSIVMLILFKISNIFGSVKFDFIYVDKPGKGFHARPEAKKVLEDVGHLIGGNWLKQHNARIIVKVLSKENINDEEITYLAKVNPVEYKTNPGKKFQHTYVAKKIILNQKNNDKQFDTHLTVNFKPKYSFKDVVQPDEYDFKSVIIHELTHSLGFRSKYTQDCPDTLEEAMEDEIEAFLQKLFQFGINEIEEKSQIISANQLKNELSFYQTINIDIDEIIWQRIDPNSSLDKYEALLNLIFKESIQTKILSEKCLELYGELCKILAEYGMTMEDFMTFQFQNVNLMFEVFELGVKKLMNQIFDENKEIKLKRFILLKIQINGNLKDSFEIKEYLLDDNISTLCEVLLFCEDYFQGKPIQNKEKIRLANLVKKQAFSLGMTIEEYSQFINTNKRDIGHTHFDRFVVTKSGKLFFDPQLDKHLIDYCFPKKGTSPEVLYFKGPNVLKYIGKPIPLNGLDVSHISMKENSIMNSNLGGYGLKLREWDAQTTAILLDLGYKVDNHWTGLWMLNKTYLKKTKSKKKKAKDTLKLKGKLLK